MGIHTPDRIDRLVLSNTAAYLGPPEEWARPIAELLAAPDMQATAEMFLRNWLPARMLREDNEVTEGFRRTLLATGARAWPAAGRRFATTICAARPHSSATRRRSSRASTNGSS